MMLYRRRGRIVRIDLNRIRVISDPINAATDTRRPHWRKSELSVRAVRPSCTSGATAGMRDLFDLTPVEARAVQANRMPLRKSRREVMTDSLADRIAIRLDCLTTGGCSFRRRVAPCVET